MDYEFAGSASYPRFNSEFRAVVALFPDEESEVFKKWAANAAPYASRRSPIMYITSKGFS